MTSANFEHTSFIILAQYNSAHVDSVWAITQCLIHDIFPMVKNKNKKL